MLTKEQLIHLRIVHVIIMLATALFIYQYSQWEDGLWIPISVIAIIGPFRPGLTINKAKQRVLGTIAGLLLSVIIWFILHYNYNLLVIICLILIYGVAFAALHEYTYFIMLVSIMLCINFDYMNLFFNNEIIYVANRAMCVLVGVCICQFYEYFIFRHSYGNSLALVEKEKLDKLIVTSWDKINLLSRQRTNIVARELNQLISPLLKAQDQLAELRESCLHGYSDQSATLELIERYQLKLDSAYELITSLGYKLMAGNLFSHPARTANCRETPPLIQTATQLND